MALQLASDAFDDGASIPERFTCDGADVSPPLSITGVPDEARSLALVVDDPDAPAGTWVHWVLWGLPAGRQELPEGISAEDAVLGGARQGTNGFGNLGYGGPCPPPGKPHRYVFELHALREAPDLEAGATKEELLEAIALLTLETCQLVGHYRRS